MAERRRLLLLGASGFLGSHLAGAATAAGLEVVAPSHAAAGAGGPACDLLDPASVASSVAAAGPDLVVNAAGAASVGLSWERPAESFALNATGVLNLLEAVAREAPAAHVLCLSSADVYGERSPAELPLGEDLTPRPLTPYGAAKAAMEALCGQYARGHGLRVAVVRAFNLIGPGQSDRFAVSGFARRFVEARRDGVGEVEVAFGNADAVRDFVDVRDGSRALLELCRRELEGTFNLCSGEGRTIAELVGELAAAAGVTVAARHDPALIRPADPPALVGDPSKLREATGLVPEFPFERSLTDLLEWWRTRLATA